MEVMIMNLEIANRLQKLRKEKGYSQEQLAAELGISRQAVSKWERAESSPDTDNLICLAKLYNVSLDYLLSTEESIEEIKEQKPTEEDDEDDDEENSPFAAIAILVIVITYILLGFLCDLWHPGWIMFVFYPVLLSIVDAIKTKKVSAFLYPVFITCIYLILGFLIGWWHPGWVLFATIPIFYIIAGMIDKER
jgi:transcriptional regulator with XRE-family HTH domain